MNTQTKPVVICDPAPRTLDLIFSAEDRAALDARYAVREISSTTEAEKFGKVLSQADFIIGQPNLSTALLARAGQLKAIFNVEGNFLPNMDYETCFRRGIHVLTTSSVFAGPVAELGLAMALDLLRGLSKADRDFRAGIERYGLGGNTTARLLSECVVGFVGFGDLGVMLNKLIAPFGCRVLANDPWLPASLIRSQGIVPASLDAVLGECDVIFVVAAATADNAGILDTAAFAKMRPGTRFILLSRASIVNFDAMTEAIMRGHIEVATDVFPEEPLPTDHPIRTLDGAILSAHRAGALETVFPKMGSMVLEDMDLLSSGLPPRACKRAERETALLMRSKPVAST